MAPPKVSTAWSKHRHHRLDIRNVNIRFEIQSSRSRSRSQSIKFLHFIDKMQPIAKYSLAAVGAGISLELLWKIYQKYVTNRKVHISEVVFFNNKHSPEKIAQLTSYIDGAQHLICLAMYQLTSFPFCNALKRAISRGVEIRFIFDCTMEGSSGSEVDNLRNKGEVNLF